MEEKKNTNTSLDSAGSFIEKRKTPRHDVEVPQNSPAPRTNLAFDVIFKKSYAREETRGTLKNISLTGAFLCHEPNAGLEPGEKLVFNLIVSGVARPIHGTVIWSNSKGSGIRFSLSNKRDLQIIDSLIELVKTKKSGSRDVLESIFNKVA